MNNYTMDIGRKVTRRRRVGARLESSDIADSEEMRGDLCVPATQGGFRRPSAEEDSPWREVSHGKGTCARKSPEGAEHSAAALFRPVPGLDQCRRLPTAHAVGL